MESNFRLLLAGSIITDAVRASRAMRSRSFAWSLLCLSALAVWGELVIYASCDMPSHKQVGDAFRQLSREAHPDKGGSSALFRALKDAHVRETWNGTLACAGAAMASVEHLPSWDDPLCRDDPLPPACATGVRTRLCALSLAIARDASGGACSAARGVSEVRRLHLSLGPAQLEGGCGTGRNASAEWLCRCAARSVNREV